jgi:hypothetical protein
LHFNEFLFRNRISHGSRDPRIGKAHDSQAHNSKPDDNEWYWQWMVSTKNVIGNNIRKTKQRRMTEELNEDNSEIKYTFGTKWGQNEDKMKTSKYYEQNKTYTKIKILMVEKSCSWQLSHLFL